MPPRDWAFRIQDILDSIAKIQRFVSEVDFEAFENDEELIDAVTHNLTVIGEAANHVPSEITSRHPDIPWRQMVDLRNFSVHAYWNLRPSVIWDTVQNDLPPLAHRSAGSWPMPKNDAWHSILVSRHGRYGFPSILIPCAPRILPTAMVETAVSCSSGHALKARSIGDPRVPVSRRNGLLATDRRSCY